MYEVRFKNTDIVIEAEEGTSLAECIRRAGLSIETPCNCLGICGKCRVVATGGLSCLSEEEKQYVNIEKNERLACIARIKGNAEIDLKRRSGELNTINTGFSIGASLDCDIRREKLPVYDFNSSRPYLETVIYDIAGLGIYKKIAAYNKNCSQDVYGIVYKNVLIDAVDNSGEILGISVDIGTTGISAYLVRLTDGKVLKSMSCLNPQTEFGGDVLTRISFCIENVNGLNILRDTIVGKINELITGLTENGFSRERVYRVMISGNTIMLHMFLGVDPVSIAKAPYRPVFLDKQDLSPAEAGLAINQYGFVTLLPSASGYVGSDILSGVIAAGFNTRSCNSIFIDIGTNGEIVLNTKGRLSATSTAAGPALEGMNISCGMRAVEGAIDSFLIDENCEISYTTIGGAKPAGICGSGLIDVAAGFIKSGIVLPSGRFNTDLNYNLKDRLRDKRFYINDEIYLSQRDIRQLQLAKGAIAAGVSMLLAESDILTEELEETVIAGAFGYHINPDSLITIGIIPRGFRGKITFVGNSSLEGARLALINKGSLKAMEELKNKIEVLELSLKEEFQQYFVKELSF